MVFFVDLYTFMSNLSFDGDTVCPFPVHLWPFGTVVFLGGFVAVVGNLLILTAVLKSPDLKSKCYLLMANLAAADLLSGLAFVLYGTWIFAGLTCWNPERALTLWHCFLLNLPFVLSFNSGCFMIFVIGLDRLLSLWKPTYYLNLNRRHYVRFWSLLSWLYSSFFVALGVLFGYDDTTPVPTCVLPTSLAPMAMKLWAQTNVCLNLAVVIVYALTYWRARKLRQTRHSRNAERQLRITERVLASITVVMSVYISTWFVTMATIFLVTSVFNCSPTTVFHSSLYVGILANVNVGSNAFIYTARSYEFRKAFHAILFREELHSRQPPGTWYSISRGPQTSQGNEEFQSPETRRPSERLLNGEAVTSL